jgi:tetratricopeptide (TPR) repeat protein
VLELHPLGHPGRTQSLDTLASYLYSRSKSVGSIDDLKEATLLSREVLELITPDHANRAIALDRLASYLYVIFTKAGSVTCLDESIRLRREVLDISPPGGVTRAVLLNDLAWSLVLRYEAQSSTEDLDESIILSRESLDIYPSGHPGRCFVLDTLARALLYNSATLEEALKLSRESITPLPNTSGWEHLTTFVMSLHRLYEQSGEFDQLREATSACKEALSICPATDPARPKLIALEAKLAEGEAAQLSFPHSQALP